MKNIFNLIVLLFSFSTWAVDTISMSQDYYLVGHLVKNNIVALDRDYQNTYNRYRDQLKTIQKKCNLQAKKQAINEQGSQAIANLRKDQEEKDYKPTMTSNYKQLGLVDQSRHIIVQKRNEAGDRNLLLFINSMQNWITTIAERTKRSLEGVQNTGINIANVSEEVVSVLENIKNQIENEEYSSCSGQVNLMLKSEVK